MSDKESATKNIYYDSGSYRQCEHDRHETEVHLETKKAPNSQPRHESDTDGQTYVYRDFADVPASSLSVANCHRQVPSQNIQSQKLPAKLAVMLSDPGKS